MAISAPTNYVLKVYNTEANALADTNALLIDDTNGAIKNSNPQTAGYGYWTHTKYWYRIEANEPVLEFYIDWDDGEDNNPKGKANYTSIKFDTPTFVGITTHIYTGNSTTSGGYFPKIRAKSIEGYWSKFYQNALGAFTHTGIDVLAGETTMAVGRNSTYKIESDSTTERIPALYPEIKPPICILKTDKKRVYAGIDNDVLRDNNGDLKGSTLTLVEGFGDNGASNIVRTGVEVKVHYTNLGKNTDSAGANQGTPHGGFGRIMKTNMNPGDIIRNVSKVLRVELLNHLEDSVPWNGSSPSTTKLYPGEKLVLVASKASGVLINNGSGEGTSDANLAVDTIDPRTVFVVGDTVLSGGYEASYPERAISDNGKLMGVVSSMTSTQITLAANNAESVSNNDELYIGYGQAIRQTVAEVSLGNPIVEKDDNRHTIFYDLTESYARTSEQSISNYYLDDGKNYLNNYAVDESYQASGSGQKNGDILTDTNGTMEITAGVTQKSYTFDLGYNFVDEDYRWLPKQVLSRGQIKVGAVMGSVNLKNFNYSYLEHWRNEGHGNNYSSVVDTGTTYNWPSDMTSSGILAIKSTTAWDRWTDGSVRNRTAGNNSNYIIQSSGEDGDASLRGGDGSGADIYDVYDTGNNSLGDSENIAMVVCARDSKWSKQFFKLGANNISTTNAGANASDQRNGKADKVIPGGYATHLEANSGIGTDGVGKAQCRVNVFYTGLENGKSGASMWKPLKRYDFTSHPDYRGESTWYTDGVWEWEEPEDWVKIDPSTIPDRFWPRGDMASTSTGWGAFSASTHDQDGNAASVTVDDYFDAAVGGGGGTDGIWDESATKYALLFLILTDGGRDSETNCPKSYSQFNVQHTWPCSNSHSSIVDIIDPMHVSLNSYRLTQSISYNHKGKHQIIENRLGKSEIRKIGSAGGTITLGGVGLGTTTERAKFESHQSKATPVYRDVNHSNGDITRFFGIITSMSQDHPTGDMIPKFSATMQVSHIITINSSGSIMSDGYISLGGAIDEPKYL